MDLVTALRLDTSPSNTSSQPDTGNHVPQVVSFTGGGGKTSTMRRLASELTTRGKRVVCTSTTRLAAYEVQTTPGVVMVSGRAPPYDEIGRALDEHGQCLLVTPEIVEGGIQKYPGVTVDLVDELAVRASEHGIEVIIVEADGAKMLPLKAPAEHEPPLPTSTTLLAPLAGMDALGKPIESPFVHRPERVRALLGLKPSAEEYVTPARIADLLLDPRGGRKGLPDAARFLPILNKSESTPHRAGARIIAHQMAEQRTPCLVASTGCEDCEPVHERWGPIAVVVLAAGQSERFGQPKQLAEVGGEPMVVRAVRTALEADVTDVVVVTGAHAEDVTTCLHRSLETSVSGMRVVHNPQWATGQAGSLHAALRSLSDEIEAALFMPADQPFLSPGLLRRLVRCWQKGYSMAAPSMAGTVRGAPALFDRTFWPNLMDIRGDVGGRDLLRRYAGQVGAVAVDDRILRDVDIPSHIEDV